jgi:hypothetical protein
LRLFGDCGFSFGRGIGLEIKIVDTAKSRRGWVKPSVAAKYSGVSLKVFRGWLKHHGLPYSTLPNGRHLVSLDDIDLFLRKFQASNSVVDELLKDF